MATTTATGQDYVALRRRRVAEAKEHTFTNEPNTGSFWSRLLDSLTHDATNYAREAGLSAEEWGEFDDLLERCTNLVANLMHAVNGWGDDAPQKAWLHHRYAVQDVLDDRAPRLDRFELEGAVSEYLDLPFRNERIDRLLVDLLVALELYDYGREVRPHLKRRTLGGWFKYRVYSALIYFGVALLGYTIADWGWISTGVADVIFGICVFLFGLETVLSIFGLFVKNPRGKLLSEMNAVYSELSSDGPISARHIEQRVKAAGEAGVVWPGPLYVLLEDINSRTGRF